MIVALFSLTGLCGGIVVWQMKKLRGTTMVAPANWCLGALVALLLAGWLVIDELIPRAGGWTLGWLLIAGTATLCPGMALLGAKRPQDSAWQMIVAALWVVLCLPAVAALVGLGGGQIGWHPAQAWFLTTLLFVQVANYAGTRFALPVMLATAGQLALIHVFLPFPLAGLFRALTARELIVLSLAIFLAAMIAAMWVAARYRSRTHAESSSGMAGLDRLWLDFRDTFGVVWALRLMQRVNQSAQQQQWPLRLEWGGFVATDVAESGPGELTDNNASAKSRPIPQEKVLVAHLNNVLRRFVSSQWIAARLGDTLH